MGGARKVWRVGAAAVGAAALVAVTSGPIASADTAGPVLIQRTNQRITLTASDFDDIVEGDFDNGQFVFTADHGLAQGGGSCEQITDVHVACAPTPEVVFVGNGGVDSFDPTDLPADTRQVGGPGRDTLLGGVQVDELLGSRGADTLRGGAAGDTIRGGDGDDLLRGNAGPDILEGGPDVDDCDGGIGADTVTGCE